MFGGILDFFFPRRCLLCGVVLATHERELCCSCLWDMPFIVGENPPPAAQQVFWGRCRIERVWPLFYYIDPYKEIVHSIKYCSNLKMGLYMGRMLGERIARDVLQGKVNPIDYLVPVPLHWRRRLKRGYNQTEVIARGICLGYNESLKAAAWGEASCGSRLCKASLLNTLLYRKRPTGTQTRRNRLQRWLNVRDAFGVRESRGLHAEIDGVHLLLVDDVLTTGATLDACANAISRHYSALVSVATLGYVP